MPHIRHVFLDQICSKIISGFHGKEFCHTLSIIWEYCAPYRVWPAHGTVRWSEGHRLVNTCDQWLINSGREKSVVYSVRSLGLWKAFTLDQQGHGQSPHIVHLSPQLCTISGIFAPLSYFSSPPLIKGSRISLLCSFLESSLYKEFLLNPI